jgi:hypothetical protein
MNDTYNDLRIMQYIFYDKGYRALYQRERSQNKLIFCTLVPDNVELDAELQIDIK